MIDRLIFVVLGINFVAWLFLAVFVAHATYGPAAAFPACLSVLSGFAAFAFWMLAREWKDL